MGGRSKRGRMTLRALLLAAAVAACFAAPARADFGCGTGLTHCTVQLDDSGRAWFGSSEKLTEDALGDGTRQGGVWQVYERDGNRTLLVSRMPDGTPIPAENNQRASAWLLGVSPDGERVYLDTDASLVPADTDGGHEAASADGYVLSGGAYTLFTTGPLDSGPNPNPYDGSHTVWASPDGRYVYFETGQRLVPEDWDNSSDIYQRFEGQTRLVSTGPDEFLPTAEWPNPPEPQPRFLAVSPDGSTAYFSTAQHLTAGDTGKAPSEARFMTDDVFAWHDGVTTRLTHTVSPEEVPGTPWESFDPYGFFATADGSVYFTAHQGQVPEDTDANPDVYRALPDGTLQRVFLSGSAPGAFLHLEAVSRDGRRFFLLTNQQLSPADHDEKPDIYLWSAGAYQLVSPEAKPAVAEEEIQLCSISNSGRRAYFRSWGSYSPQDTDSEPDVYEWSEGAVRLVSPASDGRQTPAFCSGISPNGRFVAFATWESLVPGDQDGKEDIYVVDMGAAGSGAGASASARRKPAPHRHRLRLVTAESIAPRIGVGAVARIRGEGARLRLRCPKVERSGPCHGRVRLLSPKSHRPLARGSFRIAAGRAAQVKLTGRGLSQRSGKVLARVRGADMLGNRRTVSALVTLRRGRS